MRRLNLMKWTPLLQLRCLMMIRGRRLEKKNLKKSELFELTLNMHVLLLSLKGAT